MPVTRVAPAALASTFTTSVTGAAAFALLSLTDSGDIAPDWYLGLACGIGGLIGGYLGAHLQPRLPETALRLLLGALVTALGALTPCSHCADCGGGTNGSHHDPACPKNCERRASFACLTVENVWRIRKRH